MNYYLYFLGFVGMGFLLSCTENNAEEETKRIVQQKQESKAEAITQDTLTKAQTDEKITIQYHLIALKDSLPWLKSLKGDSLWTILLLNRIDKEHLFTQDSLLIPLQFTGNREDYCPFPKQVDSICTLNKIIYISRFAQLFAIYENGVRIKWGPVSSGKESTPTPKGYMTTNWKSKRKISTVDSSWILNWCFNISNGDGISLHEYALPGYPASHSCVRLLEEDAKWIYYWADQWILKENQSVQVFGTPVIVFGDYPFGEKKTWFRLAENNKALEISSQEMFQAIQEHYELIVARQKTRVYILEKKAKEKAIQDNLP